MPSDLTGRTVLLTGASGGIGTVTASALATAGATVLAHHRGDDTAVRAALAAVPDARYVLLGGELSAAEDARRLWRMATERHNVDVVVLNAATMPETPVDGPDEVWDAGWQEALQVNVVAAGALLREAVRSFVARGSGTAIVLSSWAGEQGSRILDVSAYAASKAAIRNLAQTFARNYARDGLRVYILAPGVVRAGMGLKGQDEKSLAEVAGGLAMGRHVDAVEVARVIAYLASDDCPSLTGSTLDINGASYIR